MKHNYSRVRCVFATILALLVFSWSSLAAATIDDIMDTWRRRESSLESIRISCQHEEVIMQRTRSRAFEQGEKFTLPTADTMSRREFQYHVSGNSGFYHEQGDKWNSSLGEVGHRNYTLTYNGASVQRLLDTRAQDFPMGVIEHRAPVNKFTREVPMPLTLICRPVTHFAQLIGDDSMANVRLGADSSEETGTTQLVFPVDPQRNAEIHVWVSKDLDYLPIRWARVFSNRITVSESLAYREHTDKVTLESWRREEFRNGELTGFAETTVLDWVVDAPLSRELLNVVFPRGAWVEELQGDEQKTFLVRMDGSKRYLSEGEKSIDDYRRLVQASRWPQVARVIFGVLSIVSIVVVVIFARFKSRSRH